jgi:small multidrug resistance pump
VAYGIWGACGVALTAVLSNLIFKEPLTAIMIAGIIVIIIGVLMIELGSQAANNKEKVLELTQEFQRMLDSLNKVMRK